MQKLARLMGVKIYSAVGLMESLWHWAGRFCPQGNIGKHDDQAIADGATWDGDAAQFVVNLCSAGWLDKSRKYRLLIHDWHDHADEAVRVWLKRNKLEFVTMSRHYADTVATKPDKVATNRDSVATAIAIASSSARQEPKPPSSPENSSGSGRGIEVENGFAEFREACTERKVLEGGSKDWALAASMWRHLDFEQQAAALADARARDPDSPEMRSLPQNYLHGGKWQRPQPRAPARRRTATEQMFDEILRESKEAH